MVQQVNEQSIKVIKDFFSKDSSREFINPLASPTTPLHFEARQLPANHQQCFENPWLQNSIQMQLLNYVRAFQGVPQPSPQPGEFSQQQAPQFSPPPPQQQQQLAGSSMEQQHPTITLLQQRFQRLERDREMRHAKQLYSNHHHSNQIHQGLGPEANLPSTSGPCSCNLELSLPQVKVIASNSPRSDSSGRSNNSSSYSPVSSRALVFMEEKKKIEARSNSPRATNFMFQAPENERHKAPPGSFSSYSSFSSSGPVNPFSAPAETQLLLRDWRSGAGREEISTMATDDEEVDTSLHL